MPRVSYASPVSTSSCSSSASSLIRTALGQLVRRLSLLTAITLGAVAVAEGEAAAMRRVRAPYPRMGTAPGLEAAIRANWPAHLHRQALNVGWCESRGKANARNGQYRGIFQMGRREWATYGRGGNPFNSHHNAAAAYRYYKVAGWRPWECRP
jgi:hypothetical protein